MDDNETRLAGWAASSASPTKVSNRIKGVVLASSSLIVFFAAKVFSVELNPVDIVALGTHLSTMGGLIWGIWGAGVAFVRWIATVRS